MRSVHDMGGVQDARMSGSIDPSTHAYEDWENRTNAITGLLRRTSPPTVSLDESRRNIEALGDTYFDRSYGERTLHGLVNTLLQRGVITSEELRSKLAEPAK